MVIKRGHVDSHPSLSPNREKHILGILSSIHQMHTSSLEIYLDVKKSKSKVSMKTNDDIEWQN